MSDPDQIRADIEATRRDLGSNVDALADKVTPSKIVGRQTDKVKNAFTGAKDRVMGAASDARDNVSSTGGSVVDGAQAAVDKATGNPIAVGLIAFGVGWLASSLLPASEKEKDLTRQLSDAAQPLVQQAKDVASDVAGNLKEPAQDAAAAVKDTATGAADSVRSDATSAADDVRGTVSDAGQQYQQ